MFSEPLYSLCRNVQRTLITLINGEGGRGEVITSVHLWVVCVWRCCPRALIRVGGEQGDNGEKPIVICYTCTVITITMQYITSVHEQRQRRDMIFSRGDLAHPTFSPPYSRLQSGRIKEKCCLSTMAHRPRTMLMLRSCLGGGEGFMSKHTLEPSRLQTHLIYTILITLHYVVHTVRTKHAPFITNPFSNTPHSHLMSNRHLQSAASVGGGRGGSKNRDK